MVTPWAAAWQGPNPHISQDFRIFCLKMA